MKIGVYSWATDFSMPIPDLARAAEARGFESLFVCEHTHIPAGRQTPWPEGGALRPEYSHTLDPFVALASAAAVTTTLRLGTCICLVTQRDPITTAKTVASLDFISRGRFVFGIGAGWNREEVANHGTAFKTRFRLLRERVLAMKEIWTKEEASFSGEFVQFDRIWSWPKPVQTPHPPLLLGGESAYTLQRVVEFCDGWLPRARFGEETVLAGLAELRARAEQAGRPPETVATTVYGPPADRAVLHRYRQAGVARIVLVLPTAGPDQVLPVLDRYAELLR